MGTNFFLGYPNFRVCVVAQATSAELGRSFRNVPKASTSKTPCTGICHLCLAGRPNYDYEDVCLFCFSEQSFLGGLVSVWLEGDLFVPYINQYKLMNNFDSFEARQPKFLWNYAYRASMGAGGYLHPGPDARCGAQSRLS